MEDAGLQAPEYVETPNTVKLILRNNIDERTAHRNRVSDDAVSEAVNEAVTADEQKIIDEIIGNPNISQKMIAEKTGFSRSKVQRLMKILAERKIIRRIGADKNGYWEIKRK